jgi:hypothetical protein
MPAPVRSLATDNQQFPVMTANYDYGEVYRPDTKTGTGYS